jgi:hypothetical protein
MPLWLLLLAAGGGYWWWKKNKAPVPLNQSDMAQSLFARPAGGAALYMTARDAQAYIGDPTDPAAGPATPILIPAQTHVQATTEPPTMSYDSAYVLVTGSATQWASPMYMSIADLQVQ